MESDSDIEVIELVQDAIPDNTSNIPRIEPQGDREHEEIEERQELEDEEESEDNEEIIELDVTEGEKPEWASDGSVQELI